MAGSRPGTASVRPLVQPPQWKWWTFPVYFALSLGLFAGYNVGILAQKQPHLKQAGDFGFALLFAWGLAQFVTRPLSQLLLRRRAQRGR